MKREEVAERYKVPLSILKAYEDWAFAGQGEEDKTYGDKDVKRLGQMMCMLNLGFSFDGIERYLRLQQSGIQAAPMCLQMLLKKRQELLEEIHGLEERIGCLDSMRQELLTGDGQEG